MKDFVPREDAGDFLTLLGVSLNRFHGRYMEKSRQTIFAKMNTKAL
jgi:hypothetical protein